MCRRDAMAMSPCTARLTPARPARACLQVVVAMVALAYGSKMVATNESRAHWPRETAGSLPAQGAVHPRRGARPHASARLLRARLTDRTVASATRWFILAAPLSPGSSSARWRSSRPSPYTQPREVRLPAAVRAARALRLRARASKILTWTV